MTSSGHQSLGDSFEVDDSDPDFLKLSPVRVLSSSMVLRSGGNSPWKSA